MEVLEAVARTWSLRAGSSESMAKSLDEIDWSKPCDEDEDGRGGSERGELVESIESSRIYESKSVGRCRYGRYVAVVWISVILAQKHASR